jgi:hypothetical protein
MPLRGEISSCTRRIGIMQALHRHEIREFDTDRKPPSLGNAQASEGSMMEAASMNSSREFDEPIPLPNGRELVTLEDARALCRRATSQHARTRGVASGDGSPAIGG